MNNTGIPLSGLLNKTRVVNRLVVIVLGVMPAKVGIEEVIIFNNLLEVLLSKAGL